MKRMILLLLLMVVCEQPLYKALPVKLLPETFPVLQGNNEIIFLFEAFYPERVDGYLKAKPVEVRKLAKKRLIALAKESNQSKAEIIQIIRSILESRGPITIGFAFWYDASDMLGEIGGPESIEILVKYLDYYSPLHSLSLIGCPTIRAAIKIGEPAVPRLIICLTQDKPSIRVAAAITLGEIGGSLAKESLERALETETDEWVIRNINDALFTLSKRSGNS